MNQQVTIRPATETDRQALQALWDYCFRDGETFESWYFSQYYRKEECLIATVGKEIAASLQIIDLPTRVGSKTVPAGYIVGVDCLPEYRGQGLTRQLMQAALSDYAPAHGLKLMHLMPFEADFYESYGFVFSDYHFDMDLDIAEFYRAEDRVSARAHHWQLVQPEAIAQKLPELEALYVRATARYDICAERRGLRRWRALVDDLAMEGGQLRLLYDDADETVGLLASVVKDGAFFVREALTCTAQAQQALYYFIAAHRSQVKRVEWSAPEDERIAFWRKKDKSGVQYRPFMMSLILEPDIVPLFAGKLPEEDLRFAVEGHGVYLWRAGSRVLEPAPEEAGLSRFTLAELSQLVFARGGLVSCKHPRMAALFTIKATCFNNEYF